MAPSARLRLFSLAVTTVGLSRLKAQDHPLVLPLDIPRIADQQIRLKSFNKLLYTVLLLLSVPVATSFAQDSSLGIPYFSTRTLGVDLATNSVFISLLGRSKTGTIPFNAPIALNSHIYVRETIINGQPLYYIAVSTPSALALPGEKDFFGVTQAVTQLGPPCTQVTYYGVTDGISGLHPFGGYTGTIVATCQYLPNPTATADGEYIVTWSGVTTATAVRKDGMTSNSANGNMGTMIENPDLQSISSTFNSNTDTTTFTDTLGQTALTYNSSGAFYTDAAGNSRSFTVTDTQYTPYTAFGCSDILDMSGSSAMVLPTTISTPAGTYTLSYESTKSGTGTYGPYSSGRIAKITYPTGAYIAYTYSGGNSGFQCASQVVPTLKVEVNDNNGNDMKYWTFVNSNTTAHSPYPGGAAGNYTVTETDPAGNQTVYSFAGEYQTQAVYDQGTSTTLKTVTTCYGSGGSTPPTPPNCASPTTAPHLPFSETDVYTSFGTSQTNRVQTKFDAYSNVTYVGKYDFGASAPTTQVFNVYGQSYNSPTACNAYPTGTNIYNTPCYSHTENSSGTDVAKTKITYSNTGHPTSTAHWTSGSSWLTSTTTYNSSGTVAIATDVNTTGVSTYAYNGTDGCNSLLPTSVTVTGSGLPSGGLITSTQWDCNGGVATQTTDPNSQPTKTYYLVGSTADPLYRPLSGVDALLNTSNLSYSTTTSESAMNFNGTTSTSDNLTTADGLGRQTFAQTRQGQGSSTFDSTQTTYGWGSSSGACTKQPPLTTGVCTTQSVPYSGTAGQAAPGGTAITTTQYDALGRSLTITDGGGGTTSYTYIQNDVRVTIGPAPSGENTTSKQLEYDGLGRLTSVCEITSAAGSGSCGQKNPATGFLTQYTYDALGNLLTVIQNAQPGAIGGPQTRTYGYDGMSRLLSEMNPESGTTAYVYDTDSSCNLSTLGLSSTSNGDLISKTDANGNKTCYTYDSLHRVTDVAVLQNGACYPPVKRFRYDTTSNEVLPIPSGYSASYTGGHMIEAWTGDCVWPTQSDGYDSASDEWFAYSKRGDITDLWESTTHIPGYYHGTAGYAANGAVTSIGGIPG